jgi:hypothetical protein
MCQYEIVLPVRNGGSTVVNSIESVLCCKNVRHLLLTISNNYSTDGCPWKTALQRFPQDKWRILSPPQPLGRVEHWGWAFAQARLPWVKPLMVGDLIENGFWDWVAPAMTQFPQAGMLFCQMFIIDPSRAHPEAGKSMSGDNLTTGLYEYHDFVRDAIRACSRPGALSQVLIRADILRAALPFEPEFPWTADWRFYERCIKQAPAVETRARFVYLDRSIARLSTSWKGMRGSFLEEWRFAAEQAALARVFPMKAFLLRLRPVARAVLFKIGRLLLPRPLRAFLTSTTGLYRANKTC